MSKNWQEEHLNQIVCGDCLELLKEIPTKSIDLVLTDPPYPYEFIECWSKLGIVSKSTLKEGHYCFAYSGSTYLPEVLSRVSEHLTYWWTLILLHTGAHQAIHHRRVMAGYKPILMFTNGDKGIERDGYFKDTIYGTGRSKKLHKWGQAVAELAGLIEHYTEEGDLILDPFCGSGTTCVAAKLLGRNYIGIDISPAYVKIAEARLRNTEENLFKANFPT